MWTNTVCIDNISVPIQNVVCVYIYIESRASHVHTTSEIFATLHVEQDERVTMEGRKPAGTTRDELQHGANTQVGTSTPNVPPLKALWSLLDGIWGLLKGSWGVLAGTIWVPEVLNNHGPKPLSLPNKAITLHSFRVQADPKRLLRLNNFWTWQLQLIACMSAVRCFESAKPPAEEAMSVVGSICKEPTELATVTAQKAI